MTKKKTATKIKSKFNDKVSEEEFVLVWEKISQKLGYKFKFGYHSHEDMKQQAAIFALEGLKNYDHKRPLENFLWTHVRNRLFNYKRDNYQRPDKPCLACPFYQPHNSNSSHDCSEFSNKHDCSLYSSWITRNENKKNIMRPVGIDSISQEIAKDDLLKNISNKEIIKLIDTKISVKNRPIFLKLLGGIKVPKLEVTKLVKEIKQILKDHDIDPTT
jgi:hypothetical protein